MRDSSGHLKYDYGAMFNEFWPSLGCLVALTLKVSALSSTVWALRASRPESFGALGPLGCLCVLGFVGVGV